MTDYNDGKWHAHEARQGRPDSIKPESIVEVFGHQRTLAGNKAPFHQVAPSSHIVFPDVSAFRVVKPYQEPLEFWAAINKNGDAVDISKDKGPLQRYNYHKIIKVREVLPSDPS